EIAVAETENQEEKRIYPQRYQDCPEAIHGAKILFVNRLELTPFDLPAERRNFLPDFGEFAAADEQVAPAVGGRGVIKEIRRLAVFLHIRAGRPYGGADAPLAREHHQRGHETDEEDEYRAIDDGEEIVPHILPGGLVNVAV